MGDGKHIYVIKPEIWDSDCTSFCLINVENEAIGRTFGILHVLTKADLAVVTTRLSDAVEDNSRQPLALPLLLAQLRTG